MMGKAICEAATIQCPHGGVVTLTGKGSANLKGSGSNVVNKVTIIGASVVGCLYFCVATQATVPCTVIKSVSGESTTLKVDSNGVVLDSSSIKITNPCTDFSPLLEVDAVIVNAGQSVLDG